MAPTKNSQVWDDYFQASRDIWIQRTTASHLLTLCLKLLTMVTLKAKQKKLKASGLGNKPRTLDSLKDEEVEKHFLAKFDLYISAKQTK